MEGEESYNNEREIARKTRTFLNDDRYEGEWKDGKRNGNGAYTFADGKKYVGEFKDNKRHGQGTFT